MKANPMSDFDNYGWLNPCPCCHSELEFDDGGEQYNYERQRWSCDECGFSADEDDDEAWEICDER
jgi:transposase-like protein